MTDYRIPDLPSDKELGIEGLSEEDLADPPSEPPAGDGGSTPPPPPGGPSSTARGESSPPVGGGPRWRGPVTVLILLLAAWLSSSARILPSPAPANAPEDAFSSARAMVSVVEMARRPHPPGAPEHDRIRELLLDRLRALGLEPEIQETTRVARGNGRTNAATVRNIVARVPGTQSTGAVLVTAHYDAAGISPGAGDDATGVVTILESLRALQGELPLRNDLIILITDGEELGLLGARAFVEDHPWMADVRLVLSIEMRGAGGPSIMFETGAENGWIVERLKEADPRPLANSLSMEVYRRLPNDTDFTPFRDAGIQGLNFAAIGRSNVYHQAYDTPENLQEATLQHHGVRVLALLRALGREDLTGVVAPDRSYLTLPFLGLVSLPAGLAWPLTAAVIGALLLATFLATLRGARSRGILLSAVLSLVVVGLSAAAGWALLRWIAPLHPEYGAISPAFHREGPYVVALVALALTLVLTLFTLARRWITPLETVLGALLLPVIGLVAVTLMAPTAALNLQGPLAAVVLLVVILAAAGHHRGHGTVAWMVTLLLVLPVVAFLVPVLELVTVALGLHAAPLVGGGIALVLLLLLPALTWLDAPNRWWAPVASLAVAGISLGVGILQADPAPDRPAPSTLLYVMERDGEGLPTRAFWLSADDAGLPWAVERAGGSFSPDTGGVLASFPLPDRGYRIRTADLVAVPAPRVDLLGDTVAGDRRRVVLGIRSLMEAEALTLSLPDGVVFRGIRGTAREALDQDALGPEVRSVTHWGRPDPHLEIAVEGPADTPWTLGLVETHLRPGELLARNPFQRPPALAPNITTWSDRALVRTPIPVGGAGSGMRVDTLPGADAARDTVPPDSIPPDSISPDTLLPDTVPPDTLLPDTVPPDTLSLPPHVTS